MFPFAQSLRNFFRADRLRTPRRGRPRRTHLVVENLEDRNLLSTFVLTGQDPGTKVTVTPLGVADTVQNNPGFVSLAGYSALEIHGSGSNPIDVEGTPQGVPVSIFLTTGDTVTISGQAHDLSNIQSTVTVTGNGQDSKLTVDDQAGLGGFLGTGYTVSSTQLTRTDGVHPTTVINYSSLQGLTLNTSNKGDIDSIESLPAATVVNGGAGPSLVGVSSTAKNLDGIGSLTIDGGTGGATVTVHDEANPHGGLLLHHYTITNTDLTFFDTVLPVNNVSPVVGTIQYAHLTGLTLDTSNLRNVETVQSTATGTPVTINGGTGANAFTVGDNGSVKNILSPVTIKGSGANSALVVDDASATTQDKVTVGTAQVGSATDQFFASGGRLNYSGLGSLTLNLSNAFDDSVALTPSASTAFAVNGSPAAFQAGHGAALNVDVTGTTSPTNTPGVPGAGKWTFGNRQAVTYTNIAQMISGPVNLGSLVMVQVGPLTPVGKHRRKVGGRFQQTVTISNTGPDAIKGPFALVLDSLTPRKKSHHRLVSQVTVLNASGTSRSVSAGSPYLATGAPQLQPGDQLTFVLNFKLKGRGRITFNPIPLAGFAQP